MLNKGNNFVLRVLEPFISVNNQLLESLEN